MLGKINKYKKNKYSVVYILSMIILIMVQQKYTQYYESCEKVPCGQCATGCSKSDCTLPEKTIKTTVKLSRNACDCNHNNTECEAYILPEDNIQDDMINLKRQRYIKQVENIQDKQRLLDTRNRMLNISQSRNFYRTRIIYILLTVIISLVIITLVVYNHYS